MPTIYDQLQYILKKAQNNMTDDAFTTFLCYGWGVLSSTASQLQLNLIREQFTKMIQKKENRRVS